LLFSGHESRLSGELAEGQSLPPGRPLPHRRKAVQTAQELADSIPDLEVSVDEKALVIWLERNGMTLEQLRVGGIRASRPKHLVEARRLAAEFLRRRGWSYPMIARELGYAEHTSVLYLLNGRRRSA
jgi:hypothetical protein